MPGDAGLTHALASAALRSADSTDSPHDTTNDTAVTSQDSTVAAPAGEPPTPPGTGKHRDA